MILRYRLARYRLALGLLFLYSFNAQADLSGKSALDLWGGIAPSTTSSAGQDYRGVKLSAGMEFPSLENDKQTVRLSVAGIFNQSNIDRYNLALHIGYDITHRFNLGILGGVEYIQITSPSAGYLKPLLGAEAVYVLKRFSKQTLSAYASYETAQGSTGTLALNGGPSNLAANIFAVGLIFSFSVLQDQQTQ
jgi:hypothetical protein